MDNELITNELRTEAEKLSDERIKIEKDIIKLFSKGYVPDFEKVKKLYDKRDILQAQSSKLYEMIGKMAIK